MSKCLVVPKKKLKAMPLWKKLNRVEGIISAAVFLSLSEIQELLGVIKNNGVFMERNGIYGIEENPEWQQIIFYGLVVQKNKFFLYRRGETTAYKEGRLRAKISAGIGGHIEPFDTDFVNSLRREAGEELEFFKNKEEIPASDAFPYIKIVGVIKDEKDEVGKVHLGIVCLIEITDDVQVAIKSDENVWGKMVTLDEYQQIISSSPYLPESWTELTVEHIAIPLFNEESFF